MHELSDNSYSEQTAINPIAGQEHRNWIVSHGHHLEKQHNIVLSDDDIVNTFDSSFHEKRSRLIVKQWSCSERNPVFLAVRLQILMNSVCFSKFPFNRWLFLLIASLELKNSLRQWQSPRRNSRDKSFFFRKLTKFVPQFWIFDHTLSCFVCSSLHLCLSCSVA